MPPSVFTALGTPLDEMDRLHRDGLAAHLDDQANAGVTGLLVAGTFGSMQLLADETYAALCEQSVRLWRGRGELLVGAGDTSQARTLARIEWLNSLKIDGVTVLTPYFTHFKPKELAAYFRALADASRAPIFLYDLPQRTGCKLEAATVLTLMEHPNIHGIKCSGLLHETRDLIDQVRDRFDDRKRVIVAQPMLVDVLLRFGINEHLDGAWAVCPHWITALFEAASQERWERAIALQRDIIAVLKLIRSHGAGPTATVLLNARGIPGRYHARPEEPLDPTTREAVLADGTVRKLLGASMKAVNA